MGFIRSLTSTPEIIAFFDAGATIVVSISGGKDSDAMLKALITMKDRYGWTNDIIAVHADLGRAEWSMTHEYVHRTAERAGVPLYIVRHSYGDLIDGIRRRMATRPDAPPFPSSAARWCTSDWKRSVIDRFIRQQFPTDAHVLCAIGLRAEESTSRAKKQIWAVREGAASEQKKRYVLDWLPIHPWSEKDVWMQIGYSPEHLIRIQEDVRRTGVVPNEFAAHPAYAYGNQRLSCSMCVLASVNDLLNGATHHPEIFRELCQIEIESGFSFRHKFWLGALRPDLLTESQRAWYEARGHLGTPIATESGVLDTCDTAEQLSLW